jgi:hypothetical protein
MSIYEYIALPTDERAAVLWTRGEFIANAKSETDGWNLYCLSDFYVEVTLKNDDIVEITPFKEGERLDKYLSQIKLT